MQLPVIINGWQANAANTQPATALVINVSGMPIWFCDASPVGKIISFIEKDVQEGWQ